MAVYNKGMNAESVAASGQKLIGYKGDIDGIVQAVTGAVNTIKGNWGGSDSDTFQSEWNKTRQLVSQAGDSLDDMGKKCTTNAEKQKAASKQN